MIEQIFKVEGNFTDLKALEIKEELTHLMSLPQTSLLLDLSKIDKADIKSVNTVMMTYKVSVRHGNSLKVLLAKPSPLDELLHLTKMRSVLDIKYVSSSSDETY